MGKLIDMTGRVCGQLTVLEQAGKTSFGQIQWRCRCSCGTITIVDGGNLRTRHTVSCGCTMNVTHGEARPGQRTPEYIAWKNMLQRCRDINNKDYGARGITVFPPWKRYEKFLAYLLATIGRRPSLLLSIDRIDNDRGYEPGNIQWAPDEVQGRNRRSFSPEARANMSAAQQRRVARERAAA